MSDNIPDAVAFAWTEDEPTEPGWYAVVICFDMEEGAWPEADEWTTEKEWKDSHRRAVMMRSIQTFANEESAYEAGRANDPGW